MILVLLSAAVAARCQPRTANGITSPLPIVRCQVPDYTDEAQIAHLAGAVTLSFTIGEDGLPTDIHVISPIGLGLDENAVACVNQWRYRPAEKDGKPIPLKASLTLSFSRRDDSDWHLGHVAFQPEQGASRPVFVKAGYPGSGGAKGNVTVCIRTMIDKQGVPRDVEVASPHDARLDKQAVDIVSGWRFQPGQKDGQPVDVPATFNLVHAVASRVVINRPPR
ncbi:MAG TPA: energy transducer TonB [Bryobacteraceae bacterium]|nr:energy transducer TonB [Bryobacteraceae bacterium]